MARQYFVEIGEPERRHFIARRQSYHGNTLGALAVGGNAWRRRQFEPLLIEVAHVSPCYAYRGARAGESEAAYGARLAAELEATVQRLGPETRDRLRRRAGGRRHARRGAGGAGLLRGGPRDLRSPRHAADPRRGDVRHGPHRHAVRLRAGRRAPRSRDDRQGARRRLPADRRDAGRAARSSRRSATARASSSTATPTWAIRSPAPRRWRCSRRSSRSSCSAACGSRARRLRELLAARFGEHPNVGEMRGRGLFRGLELVADRASKRPFAPEHKLHARIKAEAMARGLLCYPMGGTIDGRARRPPAAGAAVHRQRRRARGDRRAARRRRSTRRSRRCARRRHDAARRHGRAERRAPDQGGPCPTAADAGRDRARGRALLRRRRDHPAPARARRRGRHSLDPALYRAAIARGPAGRRRAHGDPGDHRGGRPLQRGRADDGGPPAAPRGGLAGARRADPGRRGGGRRRAAFLNWLQARADRAAVHPLHAERRRPVPRRCAGAG